MKTGLQLINEIEDRLGKRQTETLEATTLKDDTRKLLRLLNRVLANLVNMDAWPMLREEGSLITEAPIDQGTLVDLTNGSVTVTISSFEAARAAAASETPVAFLEKHKEWAIQFGTNTPIYRIDKIVSPSEIELNRAWIGDDTAPTSADDSTTSLVMAMDRYALPKDFDSPVGKWKDFLSAYKVYPRDPIGFREKRHVAGNTIDYDDPKYFTVHGLDPTQAYQVIHFHPWPKQQTMMNYYYNRVHPDVEVDKDLILFPPGNLSVIIEAVIYFSDRDYEDDPRFQSALQEFITQFNQSKGRAKMTDPIKRMAPAVYGRARPVQQLGGVRIDYGDAFDRVDMFDLPK